MRIGLKDIDSTIAKALSVRLAEDCFPAEKYLHDNIDWTGTAKKGKRPPTPEEQRAFEEHKRREERHTSWGAATMVLPLIPGAVVWFQQGFLPGLATWLIPTLLGAWQMKRTAARSVLEREISPVEMRAALPLLQLSPGEVLYSQALLHLLEAPDRLSDRMGRDILSNMNELLARDREIAVQLEQVRAATEGHPVQPLEEERERIKERLRNAADEVERASIEQALRLCESRLDHARALATAPRRLEAQREAIHQALASIPLALVRQTSSASAGEEVEMTAITDRISQIAEHARAEEAAVAEVLALRGVGE